MGITNSLWRSVRLNATLRPRRSMWLSAKRRYATAQSQSSDIKQVLGYEGSLAALRDACKCPRCVDQSTMQREFLFSDIPLDIQAAAEQGPDGSWTLQWINDIPGYENHVSTFTRPELKRLKQTPRMDYRPKIMVWDRSVFSKEKRPVAYEEFMHEDQGLAKVLHFFRRYGLVFITGVPSDPDSISKVATRIAPLRNTFYGNTWNVKSVPQAKNVAYTSKYLGFHMDLLYMRESPTAQFLHCLENTSTGGESRFVDTLKAYDVLCTENYDYAKALRTISIRYEYDNDGEYYTDTKPIVESKQWDDLPQRTVSGARHPLDISTVHRIYWSPPFIGSMCAHPREQAKVTTPKIAPSRALAEIFEREDLVYETKMEAGTCVLFDNLRVLHARNAFDMNSGDRWLRGCYLDGQDVISKELALKDKIKELDAEYE